MVSVVKLCWGHSKKEENMVERLRKRDYLVFARGNERRE